MRVLFLDIDGVLNSVAWQISRGKWSEMPTAERERLERLKEHDYDNTYHSLLFDPSGGRGIGGHAWPSPPPATRMGYAGGIGPDNIEQVLDQVAPLGAAWIDMESGVRTDDRFDLDKVREVLARAERWRNQP